MDADAMALVVDAAERQLGKAWRGAIDWLRAHNKLEDIAERIATGDPSGAVAGIEDAATRFATEVHDAYVVAGQKAAAWLDDEVTEALVSFDASSMSAVAWATRNKLELVRDLSSEQRGVMMLAIGDAMRAGHNTDAIAREVRESIGLSQAQYDRVTSYRRALEGGDLRTALSRELRDARSDRTVLAAIENGTAIDAKQADRMAARYRRGLVVDRARVIGEEYAFRTVHEGVDELLDQAGDLAGVTGRVVVRIWNTRRDRSVRDSHRTMHGQARPIGVKFRTGNGLAIARPRDPSAPYSETRGCRCMLTTKLVSAERLALMLAA